MAKKSASDNGSSDKSDKWVMPKPKRGQVVLFYYRCSQSKRNTDIAFVKSVGESSVDLMYTNQAFNEVYHKDDPRLKQNPDLRNDIGGLWEFCDETVAMEKRLAALEYRIEELEAMIGSFAEAQVKAGS